MIPDFIWNRIERWLNLRPHSKWEIEFYVRQRIKKWQKRARISEDNVTAMIKKAGYVNDEAFARWWADQRVEFRRFGPVRIKVELMQKHVDRGVVDQTISEIVTPVEKTLVEQWEEEIKTKKPDWDKHKITKFLLSKGFTYESIA